MLTATMIAILTTIFSVAVKVIGMPDQIRSNFQRKSTEGLSSWFLVFTLISYCMWVLHGITTHDMTLVIGQGIGVVATSIIVWQMIKYRKNKPAAAKPAKPRILWYSAALQRALSRSKNP
jgi:uncharacterized protein with PQ loop repeat